MIPRRYAPLAIPIEAPARELDVSVKISTVRGWLALEDEANGYTLHAECFGTSQLSLRRQSVDSPWVAGSYDVVAVPENVTEPLVVWVSGSSQYQRQTRQDALTEAVLQPSWQLVKQLDDLSEYWDCQPSEHSVEASRDFAHATMCLVRVQVRRLPRVTRVMTAVDER